METSFAELKCKQVINVVDGKSLGRIIDIVLDVKSCKILGIVVPNPACSMWSLFKSGKEIFIPFHCICKIGVDVILVELYAEEKCDKDQCDRCDPCDKHPPRHIKSCKVETYTLKDDDYKVK